MPQNCSSQYELQETVGAVSPGTPVRRMTPEQLEELLQTSLRLSASEKITAENTWTISLLDHISEVVSAIETENFQVAGYVLVSMLLHPLTSSGARWMRL